MPPFHCLSYPCLPARHAAFFFFFAHLYIRCLPGKALSDSQSVKRAESGAPLSQHSSFPKARAWKAAFKISSHKKQNKNRHHQETWCSNFVRKKSLSFALTRKSLPIHGSLGKRFRTIRWIAGFSRRILAFCVGNILHGDSLLSLLPHFPCVPPWGFT